MHFCFTFAFTSAKEVSFSPVSVCLSQDDSKTTTDHIFMKFN